MKEDYIAIFLLLHLLFYVFICHEEKTYSFFRIILLVGCYLVYVGLSCFEFKVDCILWCNLIWKACNYHINWIELKANSSILILSSLCTSLSISLHLRIPGLISPLTWSLLVSLFCWEPKNLFILLLDLPPHSLSHVLLINPL